MADITVLGATGAVGRHLVDQALSRGHRVLAVARDPGRARELSVDPSFRVIRGDVRDAPSISAALANSETVVSVLGVSKGDAPGVLALGAAAVTAAHPGRMVWLGAYGTGPSAASAGRATRALLFVALRRELHDKATADATIVAAGGTVLHVGPMTNGQVSERRRVVVLADTPRQLFPSRISRATAAALLLDEAEGVGRPGVLLGLSV